MIIIDKAKNVLKLFFKMIFYFMMNIVWLLSYIIPKKKNIWIFGSWFGQKFADNSKYLFLYIKKYHPEIRSIWLSDNINVINELRKKGYEAYKTYSFKGFIYSMKTGCVILSTGVADVNRFAIARAKKIQLWHGTPLKKIGFDNIHLLNKMGKVKSCLRSFFPFLNESYDLIISASDETKKKLISAFQVDKNKVMITGYPRNDVLFSPNWLNNEGCDYIERIKEKVDFKYIFAYIPTCRGIGYVDVDLFSRYNFNINLLQKAMESLNGIFIIKPHHYNSLRKGLEKVHSSERVFIVSDQEIPDIYPLLKYVDVLVTDYSSVYFDFLLLNRPIIFAPFDINEFKKTTDDLYYDYDEVTPGPKAKSWDEVIEYISHSVINRNEYEIERKKIGTVFNMYLDGNSSMRVYNAIIELLNE